MKKTYKLENLDCANCAAKMETAVKKLDGITEESVSFITQKITVDIAEEFDANEVMKKVVKACRKVEPDCKILL